MPKESRTSKKTTLSLRSSKNSQDQLRQQKIEALQIAMQQIDKQFGAGSIMKLGEAGHTNHVDAIPTGAIAH